MAKAFYSMEEVCNLLGKTQDEVKQLVQEGSLREFRDAGKVFFKAENVNKLSGASNSADGSGELMLEPASEKPAAEPDLPSLADSDGTSMIGLEPLGDDTPAREAPASGEKDTMISASGIGVFDDDELQIDADPMADTQITASPIGDRVSLEGTGSGSGLLDLTREADDTSLGAELLDEIYPGEDESAEAPVAAAAPEAAPEAAEEEKPEEAEAAEEEEAAAPVAVTAAAPAARAVAADPNEGLFSGLLVGSLILLVISGSVVAAVLQGFMPQYAKFLSNQFWFFLGGAAAVPLLTLLIGWVIGRAGGPKRA